MEEGRKGKKKRKYYLQTEDFRLAPHKGSLSRQMSVVRLLSDTASGASGERAQPGRLILR